MMQRSLGLILAIGILVLSIFLSSCSEDKDNPTISEEPSLALVHVSYHNNESITQWMNTIIASVKNEYLTPPEASRVFAYTGVAFYEGIAVNHEDKMLSLAGQLNGLNKLPGIDKKQKYDDVSIASTAEKVVMLGIFENASQDTRNKITELWQRQINDRRSELFDSDIFLRSVVLGEKLGNAILEWSKTDGYSIYKNCSHVMPIGEGFWVPTPPGNKPPLLPCWGKLRSFTMTSNNEFDPRPPFPYSEKPDSNIYKEALEVYNTVNNLTTEQKVIAKFWEDSPGVTATPPGHSISILKQIIEERDTPLITSAMAFARIGVGLGDAFISVWDTKYRYNFIRPITYIQRVIDPNWESYVTTPPFPEYTSGHSVQSGAFAMIMTTMFGNQKFTDYTNQTPRSFNSFYEAANEAGFSRLYGGIHYRMCVLVGIEQGEKVGLNVMKKIKMEN